LRADREPPVRPAGYLEQDGITPRPVAQAFSASGEIKDRLAVAAGNEGGKTE